MEKLTKKDVLIGGSLFTAGCILLGAATVWQIGAGIGGVVAGIAGIVYLAARIDSY